jgi:hypothetical protein
MAGLLPVVVAGVPLLMMWLTAPRDGRFRLLQRV